MSLKTKAFFWIIVIILVLGGGVYYYLKKTGLLKTGAEAIIGCQNSKDISRFFGAPGSNLVSYNLFGNEVTVNKILTSYLDEIQKEVVAAKTGYNFSRIEGYNMRSKIGGRGPSLHSWGIAIDINPEANPYQLGNYGPPQTDLPGPVIDIFKKYGFAWGGDWPGERDAMHFEWYGAGLSGQVVDKNSSQKILSVATDGNGAGSPNSNGDFDWIVPFGSHTITSKSKGYNDNSFSVSLACFSDTKMDIAMEPLASNIPGSISGKVRLSNNYPLLVPANISLDGRLIGVSTLKGDYYIPNVHEGKHKVDAKVMFFPGGTSNTQLVPGENIKNVDIIIGK